MLNGFDYVEYLKRHGYIGQIDPWRRHDDGEPVLCLLTSVEPALLECIRWSGQEMTRSEFVKYLQSENVFVFRSVEEFKKYKDEKIEPKLELKKKRTVSEERRKKLQKHAEDIRTKKVTITGGDLLSKELVIS